MKRSRFCVLRVWGWNQVTRLHANALLIRPSRWSSDWLLSKLRRVNIRTRWLALGQYWSVVFTAQLIKGQPNSCAIRDCQTIEFDSAPCHYKSSPVTNDRQRSLSFCQIRSRCACLNLKIVSSSLFANRRQLLGRRALQSRRDGFIQAGTWPAIQRCSPFDQDWSERRL